MKSTSIITFIAVLMGFYCSNLRAELPPDYQFTFIPELSGPLSLNNTGQVAGTVLVGGGNHVALWENGVITILGPGTASGINNLGQIVGSGSTGGGFPSAMIWSKNAPPIVLGDLEGGGGSGSNGLGINDAGQVAGWSTTPGNPFTNVPTIWNGVTPTQLPSLGTLEGQASAINNNGQATGYSNIGTLSDAISGLCFGRAILSRT